MNKFERFCYKYNHLGVSNLMFIIAMCNIFVYGVEMFVPDVNLASWFAFSSAAVLKGQIWRLITFVFIPPSYEVLWLLLACYFYYWVGRVLENEWGKLKFNIFYLVGMAATMIYCWLSGAYGTAFYLNLSLFFAYATLFPEQRIMLFFVIPVKVKYIAIVEAALFFVLPMLQFSTFPNNLIPLTAILNYLLFFYKDIIKMFKRGTAYGKNRTSFKNAVHQARKRPDFEGHVHKCTVCGVTDTQEPNMEFRYCSLCSHYECYCSQHIFTHEHIK